MTNLPALREERDRGSIQQRVLMVDGMGTLAAGWSLDVSVARLGR